MDEHNDNPDIYFPEEEWGIWDNAIKDQVDDLAHDFGGSTVNPEEMIYSTYPDDWGISDTQRYFPEDESLDPYGFPASSYRPEFSTDDEPWTVDHQYPNEPVEQVEANDSQSEYDKKEKPSLAEIPMEFPPGKFQKINYDDLTLGKCIGRGGFAKVYKGTLNQTEKSLEVAIKKLTGKVPNRVKKEFRNEAKIMSQLNHYAIVKFYGLSLGKKKCLVMELLSAGSLYGLLEKTKISDIAWHQRYHIAKDIIEGLSYLHDKKIWHRDIKSDNILLDKDDGGYRAKLADFGLSHESLKTESSKHLSAKMSVEDGGYNIGIMLTKTIPTEAELMAQKKEAPILIKVQSDSHRKATFYVYGISRDGKPVFTELNNNIKQLHKLDFNDDTPLHLPSRNEKEINEEIINKRAHHKQYVAGTLGFIAPEILKDKSNPQYSEKSDIYAYGMLLWEMATHLKPFFDLEKNAIESKTINNEREKVPEDIDDKRYGELIRNCWEADHKTRPTTQKIKETITKLMKDSFPHLEGNLKVSVFEKEPMPPKKQRNQNDLSKPPKLKLRMHRQSETPGSITNLIDKSKNIITFNDTQLSANLHPVHVDQDIQNSAVKLFLNEGALNFQNWYHPDICQFLLDMVNNKAKCIRVIFYDTNEGKNIEIFKNQLLQLIKLSNLLNRPALFMGKEPGADNHFICGLIKSNKLLLVNPLGMTSYDICYQTLAELYKKNNIGIWLSSNCLQSRQFEEEKEGLVSCGPIAFELSAHVLESFTSTELDQILENNLKTSEPTKHDASGLIYYGINIKDLLPETLKALENSKVELTYRNKIGALRQSHYHRLQVLPTKHAQNLGVSVENYLLEKSLAQTVFNCLIMPDPNISDIHTTEAYKLLQEELSLQTINSLLLPGIETIRNENHKTPLQDVLENITFEGSKSDEIYLKVFPLEPKKGFLPHTITVSKTLINPTISKPVEIKSKEEMTVLQDELLVDQGDVRAGTDLKALLKQVELDKQNESIGIVAAITLGTEVVAKASYLARSENELSFNMGDILKIIQTDGKGYWTQVEKNNSKGWVPTAFLDVMSTTQKSAEPRSDASSQKNMIRKKGMFRPRKRDIYRVRNFGLKPKKLLNAPDCLRKGIEASIQHYPYDKHKNDDIELKRAFLPQLEKRLREHTNLFKGPEIRGEDLAQLADIFACLSDAYSSLGNSQKQKELLEPALPFFERDIKNYHKISITLTNLSNAYGDLGNVQKQKELLERALLIDEKYYGKNHYQTAIILMNLGVVYNDLGNVQSSKNFLERALLINEVHYGRDHYQVALTLVNLSNTYGDLGDVKKQKELLKRALLIEETYYGRDHYQVAITLANLSNAYGDLGDVQKQKELLERALLIEETHYGKNHYQVAITLTNLGIACSDLGNAQLSKNLLKRALIIDEEHYGSNHYQVGITLENLANSYGNLGNVQKQKELLSKCLLIYKSHSNLEHKYIQNIIRKLEEIENKNVTEFLPSNIKGHNSVIPIENGNNWGAFLNREIAKFTFMFFDLRSLKNVGCVSKDCYSLQKGIESATTKPINSRQVILGESSLGLFKPASIELITKTLPARELVIDLDMLGINPPGRK